LHVVNQQSAFTNQQFFIVVRVWWPCKARTCMLSRVMSWLAWLGLAVIITAVAAITGIKPKGTRHVAHTRMMGMARLVLLAIVIIFAYLAFRARSGG
jgi:hypothetical protein